MKLYIGIGMMIFGIVLGLVSLTEDGIEASGRMTRGTIWTVGGMIIVAG